MKLSLENLRKAEKLTRRIEMADNALKPAIHERTAGVRLTLYFPAEIPEGEDSSWPPPIPSIEVERESPFFAEAIRMYVAEAAREKAAAELGIKKLDTKS